MKTWLVGCTHVGHERIITLCNRPFLSIEEHDNHIIEQINRYVGSNDLLYIVGDVGAKKAIPGFLERLHVKEIRLAIGNHDHPTCSMQFLRHHFSAAEYMFTHKIPGEGHDRNRMIISHYPHLCWDKSFVGSYMAFSHVHSKLNHYLNQFFPKMRALDVGIDSAAQILGEYRPFALEEVISLLSQKNGYSPDINNAIVNKIIHQEFTDEEWHARIVVNFDWGVDNLPDEVYIGDNHYDVWARSSVGDNLVELHLFGDHPISEGDFLYWM